MSFLGGSKKAMAERGEVCPCLSRYVPMTYNFLQKENLSQRPQLEGVTPIHRIYFIPQIENLGQKVEFAEQCEISGLGVYVVIGKFEYISHRSSISTAM